METSYETIKLEKVKFALLQYLSNELISDIRFTDDYLSDMIIAQVRGYVWAEEVGKEFVRYPADWWQAVKERWFPAWAKRKWPVKYTSWKLEIKATYPDFRPALPDNQVVYRVVKQKGD
jgi:hypothetical protein